MPKVVRVSDSDLDWLREEHDRHSYSDLATRLGCCVDTLKGSSYAKVCKSSTVLSIKSDVISTRRCGQGHVCLVGIRTNVLKTGFSVSPVGKRWGMRIDDQI